VARGVHRSKLSPEAYSTKGKRISTPLNGPVVERSRIANINGFSRILIKDSTCFQIRKEFFPVVVELARMHQSGYNLNLKF
jgi:hypothetical protein